MSLWIFNSQMAIGGYYQSSSAHWAGSENDHSIAKIPSYITYILISFANPNSNYTPGSNSFGGSGLDFNSDFKVIKAAIALAHKKNPYQKFLLSVGGSTYQWTSPNYIGIIALMIDLGLDGIDIDYENIPSCQNVDSDNLSCNTDKQLTDIINNLRAHIPAGKLLTAATLSVGAYGTSLFPNSKFGPSSSYAGMWVNPLRNAGDKLDSIFVMSYDASPAYSPIDGFRAYKSLFKKNVLIGLEVPPEAWGRYVLNVNDALKYANYAKDNQGSGVFIWSFHKHSETDANTFIGPICGAYGLSNCDEKIPLN